MDNGQWFMSLSDNDLACLLKAREILRGTVIAEPTSPTLPPLLEACKEKGVGKSWGVSGKVRAFLTANPGAPVGVVVQGLFESDGIPHNKTRTAISNLRQQQKVRKEGKGEEAALFMM